MVQKSSSASEGTAKRGRPRAYDPATALARATAAFWDAGFAATSLDDLAAATGMNRPSLYGAFGDKHALYRAAFDRYVAAGDAAMADALADTRPLREGLRAVYAGALALYYSGDPSSEKGAARGCFMIGTTLTEAAADPELRTALRDALRGFDRALAARFRVAHERGELAPDADPAALAMLASGFLYFLAIRSRAGEPRAALAAAADAAVAALCGPAPKRRKAAR
jgi:AcrR family transcriptional regulator